MSSGVSFSGLSSGIDSGQIIEQLIAIERRPIVFLENQQLEEELKLQIFGAINTSLLSVKTSAELLSEPSDFDAFNSTSSDTDLVDVSVSGSASPGSFTVEVLSLAQAQTRSSKSFSDTTSALSLSGDIVINGKAVEIATADSLSDIKDAINNANKGVQAQILSVSDTDHRLLLSSEAAGEEGFSTPPPASISRRIRRS